MKKSNQIPPEEMKLSELSMKQQFFKKGSTNASNRPQFEVDI
jgi:hypothetical protein